LCGLMLSCSTGVRLGFGARRQPACDLPSKGRISRQLSLVSERCRTRATFWKAEHPERRRRLDSFHGHLFLIACVCQIVEIDVLCCRRSGGNDLNRSNRVRSRSRGDIETRRPAVERNRERPPPSGSGMYSRSVVRPSGRMCGRSFPPACASSSAEMMRQVNEKSVAAWSPTASPKSIRKPGLL
jgi:hypothetical protein